ncbi:hypothetical protein BGZ60DRAFT_412032 [Tricladium varicosporioides]|nr:hypothetical protein BGZ60DRAFT_412032 [Hymenoscyphus varicosporioides]
MRMRIFCCYCQAITGWWEGQCLKCSHEGCSDCLFTQRESIERDADSATTQVKLNQIITKARAELGWILADARHGERRILKRLDIQRLHVHMSSCIEMDNLIYNHVMAHVIIGDHVQQRQLVSWPSVNEAYFVACRKTVTETSPILTFSPTFQVL